jgi:hypothetical protein
MKHQNKNYNVKKAIEIKIEPCIPREENEPVEIGFETVFSPNNNNTHRKPKDNVSKI